MFTSFEDADEYERHSDEQRLVVENNASQNREQQNEERLSYRTLIEIIVMMPIETLTRISQRSADLKYTIKIPMVSTVMLTGMLASMSTLFNKFIGELFLAGDFWDHLHIIACCLLVSGVIVPISILLKMTKV